MLKMLRGYRTYLAAAQALAGFAGALIATWKGWEGWEAFFLAVGGTGIAEAFIALRAALADLVRKLPRV